MNMNKKELETFAKDAAKGIKTPEDLNEFSQMLKKITVEACTAQQRKMKPCLSLNGLLKHGIASTLKSPNHGVRTGIISTPCLTTLRTSAGRFTPPTPLSHRTALSAEPSKNIRYFPVMIQPKKWCTWQLNTPVKNGRCRFITGVRR